MPRFAYRAADPSGKIAAGESQADNENNLYAELHQRGLVLINCKTRSAKRSVLFAKILPLSDQLLLCRHLVALLKAGVPVHMALGDLAISPLPKLLSQAIAEALEAVLKGASLSDAFRNTSRRFDPLFSILLNTGEKTGKLIEALGFLLDTLSWKEEFGKQLKRLLFYPAMQIVFATIAVIVLMTVAVPRIIDLLTQIDEKMPWYSALLLTGMQGIGILLAAAVISLAVFVVAIPLLRLHADVALKIDALILRLPLIGRVTQKIILAQVMQIFAAMQGSGMAMMEALVLLPDFTGNHALARDLREVQRLVASGSSLSNAMTRNMLIPPYVVRILKMGEDGGKMAECLQHISQVYQQESQQDLENMVKIISLFITLAVGLALASMVTGVMVPLYQGLSQMVSQ